MQATPPPPHLPGSQLVSGEVEVSQFLELRDSRPGHARQLVGVRHKCVKVLLKREVKKKNAYAQTDKGRERKKEQNE